jgi:membrane protein
VRERLDRLGQRWPWLGTALGVHQRFGELQGNAAASAITLTAFVSLFPLLLVVIAVIGFMSGSNHDLASNLVKDLGLTGEAAKTMKQTIATARHSAKAASAVGLVGLAWSGLNLIAALQHGVNLAWQTEGQGFKAKLLGVPWLAGAAIIFTASFTLSTLLGFLPGWLAPANVLVGLAVDLGLFLWTFWLLGTVKVGVRALLPGAVSAALGFEVLKVLGSVYVPKLVASSSALYGSLGIVFAILAWLLFFGRLLVYSSVLNVVRYERTSGTVSLEIEAPRIPGEVPIATTRAGVVVPRPAEEAEPA